MPLQQLSMEVIEAYRELLSQRTKGSLWRLPLEQEKNTYPIYMRIIQLCLQHPDPRIPLDSFILKFDQDFWELKACDRMLSDNTYYQGAVQTLSEMSRSELHSATQADKNHHMIPYTKQLINQISPLAQTCLVWWDHTSRQFLLKYSIDSTIPPTGGHALPQILLFQMWGLTCYVNCHWRDTDISVPWWHHLCFLESFCGQGCCTVLCSTPPLTIYHIWIASFSTCLH